MLNLIKDKIAHSVVDWKLKSKEIKDQTFTEFFKRSFNFLALMPQDDADFAHSIQVLYFLEDNKKHVTALTYDFKVSLMPLRFRPRVIEHSLADMNLLKLPSNKIIEKLNSMHFNVIMDLNKKENLFCSYISSTVEAPIRIGFHKPNSDRYYNLQILDKEKEAEISYQNLLNCLKIFQG
jgi:Family of unknown function (DUF6913)